jgi:hypothetical protein
MGEPIALEGDLPPWAFFSRPLRQAQGRLYGTEFVDPASHAHAKALRYGFPIVCVFTL